MTGIRQFVSRRRFFVGVAVGAGATAIPHWLAHAFGLWGHVEEPDDAAPECPTRGVAGLSTLVLVIPEEPSDRWERGYVFGAWLNHATDEQLAPLAAVNVRCARMGVLGVASGASEPWAVLVADSDRSRSKPVELEMPTLEAIIEANGGDPNEVGEGEVRASVRQIDLLATAINHAIEAELPVLAEAQRAALDADEATRLDQFLRDGGDLSETLLDRSGAVLLQAARDEPARHGHLFVLLAGAVRRRLVAQEVPGSRWARGSGCGEQIEGEGPRIVGCGMGHVPALSRRFLHFFPKD